MNIIKMIILPKAIYRFSQIIQFVKSIKLPINWYLIGIFHKTRRKKILICMEAEKTSNSQSNLEKENRAGGIRCCGLRLYYKAINNQNSMVLAQKQK